MSESAMSAKRGWAWFGAKSAQSEMPVRVAGQAASTQKRAQWGKSRSYKRDWEFKNVVNSGQEPSLPMLSVLIRTEVFRASSQA